MSRRRMIAGNWKLNHTLGTSLELARELRAAVAGLEDRDIVVAPPYPFLQPVSQELAGSNVSVGAQEVFFEPSGAWTGAVSGSMLTSVGCRYVLVGHSERRQHFGETDETVHRRMKAALAANLIPILCVGETLEERESGATLSVVRRQVDSGVSGLSNEGLPGIVIAYEPVWAIGTGKVATPEQAQEVHAGIRSSLAEQFESAERVRILYGGSVKPANAYELFSQADIDGGLVGGASLIAEDFSAIVKA